MSTEYTQYIVDHKNNVMKAYEWLKNHGIVSNSKAEASLLSHDISKYHEDEYDAYDDYFYGGTRTKQVEEAFNYAWLHHIHNNPHHWQYWVLVNDDSKGNNALKMPEEFVIEMICDWFSFSIKQDKPEELFKWYDEHKKIMQLHPETRKFVEDILKKIKGVLEKEQ